MAEEEGFGEGRQKTFDRVSSGRVEEGNARMLKEKPHIIEYWPKNTKYLLCIDESGIRDLSNINPDWPILSICGVLLDLGAFDKVKKTLGDLKDELWPPNGLDESGRRICLHSRDMRRKIGSFSDSLLATEQRALMDRTIWQGIFGDLGLPMKVFSAIIDKRRLSEQYFRPDDPYNLAVTFLLERAVYNAKGTAVLFESRGETEDKLLYDHVKNLFANGSTDGGARKRRYVYASEFQQSITDVGFHPKFNRKGKVVCGLELADLGAYALGSWYVRGTQTSYGAAILRRLHGYQPMCPAGVVGKGLKAFPDLDRNQGRTLFGVRP